MSLTSRLFLQYLCRSKWQRRYNTLANVSPKDIQNDTVSIQNEPFQTFRTIESNPINHNEQHLNRLYTIPDNIVQTFYKINGIPANYLRLANTFNECSLLVRNPTIEILSYLEQADYSRPINKYLLYGKYGTGKSLAITHILHYAFMKEMIIVHVPTPTHWFKNPKEIANSTTMPGIIDLPVDAGKWLLYFKSQNEKLLSKLDLRISKDYQWNIRELSPKGTPLLEIIDFGINRVRYATGVIDALCTELKESSIAGKCKVLVAVDGYNSFWSNHTRIRNDAKVWMKSQQISLTLSFLNFVKADWCNGAAVLVVDSKICQDRKEYVNPRFLLGKEGFEFTDPFLPILVENYNKTEFESIMEYYNDRKWVRNITSEGLAEIWALTAGNPCEIMKFCRSL